MMNVRMSMLMSHSMNLTRSIISLWKTRELLCVQDRLIDAAGSNENTRRFDIDENTGTPASMMNVSNEYECDKRQENETKEYTCNGSSSLFRAHVSICRALSFDSLGSAFLLRLGHFDYVQHR
jgi:hypothetical protein